MHKIITISREFGSGGRELGRRLSEKLGFAYYDQEIITEIAKKTQLAEGYVQNIMESKPIFSYPIHIGVTFQTTGTVINQQRQAVFREQCNLLKELAEKSDCVIVGRCGDYILADYHPYRIFVYSDLKHKMIRCRMKGKPGENMSDRELKRSIAGIDKGRRDYYNFVTMQTWGEKSNYDLCINTANVSIKGIVPYLAQMLQYSVMVDETDAQEELRKRREEAAAEETPAESSDEEK